MEVLTALIADSASDYQGKLCVLGSFDTICARQYPAIHPHCSIALRLLFRTGDEGKHVIQISFIDQDGKQVLPQGGPKIEFNMAEPPGHRLLLEPELHLQHRRPASAHARAVFLRRDL